MKIVHLCLACFFPDGYSYQENMLPKYHNKLGHDVTVIASLQTFDSNGKVCFLDDPSEYINENNLPVIRLAYKQPLKVYRKLKRFVGTYEAIEKARPDILFIHGCQFMDMNVVVKYLKKHPNVTVYVDNHADFSNSAKNWMSFTFLHKILWKHCAKIINPYTKKFYGVLPARVDFLKNVYNLPPEKIELLVMGADDDRVEAALEPEVRSEIRKKYGIAEDDFLIITGGKIDNFKKQILYLMEAVNKLQDKKVKLIVFGSVIPELKENVEGLVSPYTQYIGWVQSDQTDKYYAASDLVVFPGRHSVFWEQVAGLGKPMLCKAWDGTRHVDLGGNVIFLEEDSVEEIYGIIKSLTEDKDTYQMMKTVAEQEGKKVFSYSAIAKRSIE